MELMKSDFQSIKKKQNQIFIKFVFNKDET